MENLLESAGNSLKSCSSNLMSFVYISIGTLSSCGVIALLEGKVEGKLMLCGIVVFISSIISIVRYFNLIRNLKNAGESLIEVSKSLEIKSSKEI